MAGEHEEIDPIKSNPNSHKAVGVALMAALLVGLGYWLGGSPFSNGRALCVIDVRCGSCVDSAETDQCVEDEIEVIKAIKPVED